MLNQLPPQNVELEESILSTILVHSEDELFELEPTDFYRTSHQTIYKTCLDLYNAKNSVDLSTVANELLKSKRLEEVGGAYYLSKLVDQPPVVDIEYSVNQLRGYANLRRMIELSNAIQKQCYKAKPEDVESVVDNLQRESLRIGTTKKENFTGMSDIISDTVDYCETIARNKGLTGISTGYELLDGLLCGFQPSDLVIIGARPSMGKTALAVNCMLHAAKLGHASDFYSLEMAKRQIGTRMLAVQSMVNSQKFRSGKFDSEDWQKITDAAGEIYNYPIMVDDTPTASYQELQRKARKSKKLNDTKIIWIDYLSFLTGDKDLKKVYEVETITRGLKSLAKELNIPIVLLCQLSRLCEQRGDKRPMLSDLRDSGAIEQDADVVLFLYRDEVYNKDENNPNKGVVEVDVAKQRNGPTGRVKLTFLNSYTKFENLASWNE